MRRLSGRILVAAGLVAAFVSRATESAAHHSFAMYNRSVTYVLTGVVDEVKPNAGHLQILFVPLNERREALLRDAKGERVTWSVEMAGAGVSAREGISVSTFPRGTVFSVALMPLRSGEPSGARTGALFRCPQGKAPAQGRHCDSVEGATRYGEGELTTATDPWSP